MEIFQVDKDRIPTKKVENDFSQSTPIDVVTDATPEDIRFMKEALKQAKKALDIGEVPIGTVIVYDGKIIARGYNRRNSDHNTLAHGEITAIRKACRKLGDWRLEGCTLYCTLEPCQMCAGAIVQARMDRVVIGAPGLKFGCGGTLINILQNEDFNHQVAITRDVLKEQCVDILHVFFQELRRKNKMRRKALREAESIKQQAISVAYDQ